MGSLSAVCNPGAAGTSWPGDYGGSQCGRFKDDDFSFLTENALGATYHQAADVGEVLSTVERIRNGHAQSWVDEWTATADRLAAEAGANAAAGRLRSAARQFLRVSMYYWLASSAADGTGDPHCARRCGKSTARRGTVSST